MLHLLAQAFLGLASPVSGVLLSALSGVLANGGGGCCLIRQVLPWTGMLCLTKSVFLTSWLY